MTVKTIGTDLCDCCGERVHWRENERGTLSYHCLPCGFQGYAKPGEPANATMRERMRPMASGQSRQDEAPPHEQKQPATPPSSASGLLLG